MKKIYRKFVRLTEEEQKEKFGFSEFDLIKKGKVLMPPYNEIFEKECYKVIDTMVEED